MRLYLCAALALAASAIPLRAENTAVLPFSNVSSLNTGLNSAPVKNPSSMDWIGESIAETLRGAFATRGVLTIERNDIVEAYRRLQLGERTQLTEASILK